MLLIAKNQWQVEMGVDVFTIEILYAVFILMFTSLIHRVSKVEWRKCDTLKNDLCLTFFSFKDVTVTMSGC